jgi:bla regulator protein BlaR1
MLYILKTIICAALFLGVYYVLLEKEKMLRFNRAYLLLATLLSFCVPLITFTTEIKVFPALRKVMIEQPAMAFLAAEPVTRPVMHVDLWPVILVCTYIIATGFLLVRFSVNIYRIIRLIRNNPTVQYGSARLVLVEEDRVPYSFLHYIFLNRDEYANDTIEKEVYHHEMEHVRQKHSMDIILMELAMVFLWFNPFLYLYRRAIQLNHEFLADEAVIRSFQNPIAYQFLLLNKISRSSGLAISSSFNYKVTKKRLVMITKNTTKKVTLFKAVAVLPIIGAAVFMFSTRTIAQAPAPVSDPVVFGEAGSRVNAADTTPKKPEVLWPGEMLGGTREGVSTEMLKEFQDIVDKYLAPGQQDHTVSKMPSGDKTRLETIFKQMNKAQQLQQKIIFGPTPKPLQKKVPSVEQMKAFSDPNLYGIWIDDKKVSNEAIGAYKNTDISWYMISNLYGAAKKGRKYKYQLNIMTNANFAQQNENLAKNPQSVMLIRYRKP